MPIAAVIRSVLLALVLLLAGAFAASAAELRQTRLVDRPDGVGPLPFDGVSGAQLGRHALSADGRFVVFCSSSDVLLDGDDDSSRHVYRLDRATGALRQVDTRPDGGQLPSLSELSDASVSADGRFVAFQSWTRDGRVVDVKDLVSGSLTTASRGDGADGALVQSPWAPEISGDGRHVVFLADSPVHAANGDGGSDGSDAFVRDLDAQRTWVVSVSTSGAVGGQVDAAAPPAISYDGSTAAFVTAAPLVASDGDALADAYVRQNIGGVAVTWQASSGLPNAAEQVDVAGDGGMIALESSRAIYQASLTASGVGPLTRVSLPRPGVTAPAEGEAPQFEPVAAATQAPRRLSFLSSQRLDAADRNDADDLYTVDQAQAGSGAAVRLATSGTAAHDVATGATADGGATIVFEAPAADLPGGGDSFGEIALRTGSGDVLLSRPAGTPPGAVAGADLYSAQAVSDDGQTVAFVAAGSAFGSPPAAPGDQQPPRQVLVRRLDKGRTMLASHTTSGAGTAAGADMPQLDAAGDRVAFLSAGADLGAANPTHHLQAWVSDLSSGRVELVSRTAAGQPLPDGVQRIALSDDGTHLAYLSSSGGRPGVPDDNLTHAFVVDLLSGATQLADRAAGAAGALADRSSRFLALDGDGGRVAFGSSASNLGAGRPPTGLDLVYVRDLADATTTWVSRPQDGTLAHADSNRVALDRSGTRVAFDQDSGGFGHGQRDGTVAIFVADLAAGTMTLASLDPAGGQVGHAAELSLSADGRTIAFTEVRDVGFVVYRRDLAGGVTTAESLRLDGSLPLTGTGWASISGDGRCVAFAAQGTGFEADGYGPDFAHVHLRCPAGAPPGGELRPPAPPARAPPPARRPDRTAPRISKARLTRTRFATGGRARRGRAVGSAFAFTLSEAATIKIAITRRATGRRRGARCVAPRRGRGRRCTRTLTVMRLSRSARRGSVRIAFRGRAGRTTLAPGRYRAALVARDAAGNASRPVTLAFTVVR
ncbi:hypothetical protein Q5424_17305 [Conexibacter sp. JD483]|uniref:hypothetical protein n=1 Tax=unclassified Conexibacter TaxID=2627773 RepID=UPI00271B836E|nr:MULTISPECIES: hypothetical protein [unclassified Conexibacter]MDO8188601.1 hypothetical protein [Conexibacter sp. CPCC 205706]MDO8201491.1 hypothetical protein [Conexibacter sp. CPCC 205762]MDR9370858.1 hypothetical protein [Conexibacter sp. JD483]